MDISLNIWEFFCPNERCGDYGKRGHGNIVLYDMYGKSKRKLLKCRTCNSRFSERKKTFFFGLHTEEGKIREVISNLLEGKSFREVAVEVGLDKDTVHRIWKKFVAYCEESMDALLKEFNINLQDLIVLLYRRNIKDRTHEK